MSLGQSDDISLPVQMLWFLSERQGRLSRFAVNYLVERTAKAAGFEDVHPHCLRHSCGYALADKGTDLRTIQEWLGHRSVEMTVRYTRISQHRFDGFGAKLTRVWETLRTSRKSRVRKRGLTIAGRRSSISIEDAFWNSLKEIANERHQTLTDLINSINAERQHLNLSSALRLYVLDYYKRAWKKK